MLGPEQGHLLYLSFQPHQTHSNYHRERLSSPPRVLLCGWSTLHLINTLVFQCVIEDALHASCRLALHYSNSF